MNRPELLAPGGSFDGMRGALNAGADAVYMGGRAFGARAYADNPDDGMLIRAIEYCHLRGKKLYLTVNTLLKERELEEELYDYLKGPYEAGVDAVLVQDMGVLAFIRENFPGLPLHASTQMSIQSVDGAVLAREMGCSRIVPARELSLGEVKDIIDTAGVEVECFIHGALCYCYSGQCLASSLIGGRSGNRGRCAQPCRLPGKLSDAAGRDLSHGSRELMSLKDICALPFLPDLIEAGIASFKIEGRMKQPEYAAGVTAFYRKYIDLFLDKGRDGWRVCEKDLKDLQALYSRRGYAGGYYFMHNGPSMMEVSGSGAESSARAGSIRTDLQEKIRARFLDRDDKLKIKGKFILRAESPAILDVSCGSFSCSTEGMVPEKAKTTGLAEEEARKQLQKTGDTPFAFEELKIELEQGLFVPVSRLNSLRRDALGALYEKITGAYRRSEREQGEMQDSDGTKASGGGLAAREAGEDRSFRLHVLVSDEKQLRCALSLERVARIYLDSMYYLDHPEKGGLRHAAALVKGSGRECFIAMPWLWHGKIGERFEELFPASVTSEADGFLVRHTDQLPFCARRAAGCGQALAGDSGIYVWNRRAKEVYRSLGLSWFTLSHELNRREMLPVCGPDCELTVYGYQKMMISAQCLKKNTAGCDHHPAWLRLTDRTGRQMPVRTHCGICMNTIYNGEVLYLADVCGPLADRIGAVRYDFTVEDPDRMRRILTGEYRPAAYTRGHFNKGAE